MTLATAVLSRPDDGRVASEDPAAGPRRRRFTAEYKLAIVAEYDACTDPGGKGALLRRKGLQSSHLVEWRRAQQATAPWPVLSGLPRLIKRTPE